MSKPSNFLSTLQKAFLEMDRAAAESASSELPTLPPPVPPSKILERIRNNDNQNQEKTTPLFMSAQFSQEFQMAARKGKELSPEAKEKMRENREGM